jgi:hypothetical protein
VAYGSVAFLTLVPQFVQWKTIYGKYVVNPHDSHFLKFPPRFVGVVLFSTKGSWFVWTPIAVLFVVGLLWGCREKPSIFLPWTLALAGEIVIIGAIFNNDLGESFGLRMMTCTLSLSALGLFYLLLRSTRPWRRLIGAVVLACALFTTAFALQYRMDLLPKEDFLTFSELVSDKVHLRRALQRRALSSRCRAMLAAGEGRACREMLEAGVRRLGEDRFVLQALVAADHAIGDDSGEAAARARLEAFLARRIW